MSLINAELINAYKQIRDNINNLLLILEVYQNEFWELSTEVRKEYYYEKRMVYNALKRAKILNVEMAALFFTFSLSLLILSLNIPFPLFFEVGGGL